MKKTNKNDSNYLDVVCKDENALSFTDLLKFQPAKPDYQLLKIKGHKLVFSKEGKRVTIEVESKNDYKGLKCGQFYFIKGLSLALC